jgi:hypothetical protein
LLVETKPVTKNYIKGRPLFGTPQCSTVNFNSIVYWICYRKLEGKLSYKKVVICHDDNTKTKYDEEFKQKLVELSHTRGSAKEIAEKYGVLPELLFRWRREAQKYEHNSFPGQGKPKLTDIERAGPEVFGHQDRGSLGFGYNSCRVIFFGSWNEWFHVLTIKLNQYPVLMKLKPA